MRSGGCAATEPPFAKRFAAFSLSHDPSTSNPPFLGSDAIRLRPASDLAGRFPVTSSGRLRSQADIDNIMGNLKFGAVFSDYMARSTWTPEDGWQKRRIEPYGPLLLDPAASVFHYGQEIFEGLKAYRYADGSVWTFRPGFNAARMNSSARRLALPELPEEDFIGSLAALVAADQRWVPRIEGGSLYLRPFMISTEAFLGVRVGHLIDYLVIASPVGPYFQGGFKGVHIWVESNYHRSGPGGMGSAKTGGNYAASLLPQLNAANKGFSQVCFLDAKTKTAIEELGGMNVFVVNVDGSVRTPALTGTILEGSTRASVIQLLIDENRPVYEDSIVLAELLDQIRGGQVSEMFACGTAAVITPIARLAGDGFDITIGDGKPGERTRQIHGHLTDIQYGRRKDPHNWMYRLV